MTSPLSETSEDNPVQDTLRKNPRMPLENLKKLYKGEKRTVSFLAYQGAFHAVRPKDLRRGVSFPVVEAAWK